MSDLLPRTGGGGSSGADTALSNLASVAINTSLISDTDNTDDLGSSGIAWKDGYIERVLLGNGAAGTPSLTFQGDTDVGFFYGAATTITMMATVAGTSYGGFRGSHNGSVIVRSPSSYGWGASNVAPDSLTLDTLLSRYAAGRVTAGGATVGSTGDFVAFPSILTVGTMTQTSTMQALLRRSVHRFSWTNAMVVALGAGLTGDIAVCTLPAKFVVTNAFIVITGTAAGVTTLTVAVGRTAALYIDWVVASDAKVAANTVYGDADAERGANMPPTKAIELPSFTGTTVVNAHFISTVQNLDQTTGSTGEIHIEGYILP